MLLCFRPLTGISGLQTRYPICLDRSPGRRFRPLTGISGLQTGGLVLVGLIIAYMFPSPYGD